MKKDDIHEIAHHFDRLLARHGYIPQRASEVLLMQPCSEARRIGDHVRFMLRQLQEFDDVQKKQRWLAFAEGVMWTLGISTILEVIEAHRGDAHLEVF